MTQEEKYKEALSEAEEKVKRFPTTVDSDGRVWVEVEGHKYPKDWFVRRCDRLRAEGYV